MKEFSILNTTTPYQLSEDLRNARMLLNTLRRENCLCKCKEDLDTYLNWTEDIITKMETSMIKLGVWGKMMEDDGVEPILEEANELGLITPCR